MFCFVVEFSFKFKGEAIDVDGYDSGYSDGYSDVSGESSPSPQSPRSPPLSPVSDGVRFVYFPVVPYYIIPVYRSDIPLAISPAFDQYSVEENVDFSFPTPSFATPSIGRLIKWTLPPPTIPNYPLPDWDPMP